MPLGLDEISFPQAFEDLFYPVFADAGGLPDHRRVRKIQFAFMDLDKVVEHLELVLGEDDERAGTFQ